MLRTSGFFESLCSNAKHNTILVMDTGGVILQVNQAFISSFGYSKEDVLNKHFSMLFTEEDRKRNKPNIEIQKVNTEGSGNDDNYLVQKSGKAVWVNGESVLVTNEHEEAFIVKIIHNIEAQKQLERFLVESNDFIETILDSITDKALIILDTSMKVIKANSLFTELFNPGKQVVEESKLSSIPHPLWSSPEVKQLLRNVLVKNEPLSNVEVAYSNEDGSTGRVSLSSKFLHTHDTDKRILLVVSPIA